jgi:hypothetical protein
MIIGSSSDTYLLSDPFREPLQIIVIAVISVMSSTFTDTYGILCMTITVIVET